MESGDDSPLKKVEFDDLDLSNQSSKADSNHDRYHPEDPYNVYSSGYGQSGKKDMSFSLDLSRDWKTNSFSGSPEDAGRLRIENNQLKVQIKQLTADLQGEQDSLSNLRKRLNTVERDRLESASKYNNEISALESQIAKLRTNLEKGEAAKANTEFELTRARRDIAQTKQAAVGRESSLEESNNELKKKLTEYGNEIKRLEESLQQARDSGEERERQLKREIEIKEMEISKSATENEMLQAENGKLNALIQKHESAISELNERLHDMESEKKMQGDNLRRNVTELEYCKEREARHKKDLESALQRLRAVEESIESERAAHLETKFNSEIVQLRTRDLEGALEVEKSANTEANKAIDRLTKQIREFETTCDDERKNAKQFSEKLYKLEKEHSSVKKQLTSEVETKKTTIGNLSKELEIHQKNFIELKDELSKARKRQIYLEETYGGSMRELELLLQNFQIGDGNEKPPKRPTKGKDSKGSKTPAPAIVLENLRHTLTDYRKRLDKTSEELNKMKKSSSAMTKEIDQCKEMIWAKDKALEDAQKSYTRTAKELNRVRSEYGELETLLTRLKVDMQSTASNQSKDRTRIQELSEEIMKLVKKHKTDEEEKLAFLHGLYQRLLAGRIVVPTKDKGGFNQFSWHDLTNMVYDQVSALMTNLQNSEEKIAHLEEALRSREEGLTEAQSTHEESLNKLSTLTKERELSWQKQKAEMENHYQQLLAEMQSRVKKSQSMADQAWEKIRSSGNVQQGLESECVDLQTKLDETKKQNSSLLASCALLIGAFYPLCSRANCLSLQRRIMEDQLNNWDVCKERVELLVNTLTTEMNPQKDKDGPQQNVTVKRSPSMVFRSGAIAVIAANRLRRLGDASVRSFVTYESANAQNNLLVCAGGTERPVRDNENENARDSYRDRRDQQVPGEVGLLDWLTSSELLHTLTSSTSELLETVNMIRDKDRVGSVDTRAVVNAARNSFTRLFDRLGRYYESMTVRPDVGFRERNSLVRVLGRGLGRVLRGRKDDETTPSSPQDLMVSLQTHILEFIKRLHTTELERCSLLQEVSKLQEEIEKLGPQREELVEEGDEVAITQQGNKYVPLGKFESVCVELNNALRREEQAQELLQEQGRQLEEISSRMDIFSSEGIEKEQTLSEAIQGLAETKFELRRKDQTVRQVYKQLAALEGEKESLQNNLQDAEKALRTVAKDKEILTTYLHNVENALIKFKQDMGLKSGKSLSLSNMLLDVDFIPKDVGKAGPELIACQNLVGTFVDTQHHLTSKVKSLEAEIDTNKHHVNMLKQELSDAVRREQEQFEFSPPTKDSYGSKGRFIEDTMNEADMTERGEFMPLMEDSEISYNVSRSRPRPSPSPKKSDRSGQYSTPHRSTRTSTKQRVAQR